MHRGVLCSNAGWMDGSVRAQTFMDRSDTDLRDSLARLMVIGLALLFLGKPDQSEAVLVAVGAIQHPIRVRIPFLSFFCCFHHCSAVTYLRLAPALSPSIVTLITVWSVD